MKFSLRVMFILSLALTGCATTSARGRFLAGAAAGAVAVGGSATALSPNPESRGMNALVFGLTGAVLGGIAGLLSVDESKLPDSSTEGGLQTREKRSRSVEYVAPVGELPHFLKGRLQAPVIEEYVEADSIGEDGVLREPHKVYRIKRQAELLARPKDSQVVEEKSGEEKLK